jgi:ribosomal protein S18 acetylase RimI-like enzyme
VDSHIGYRPAQIDDLRFLCDSFVRSMRESIAACRGRWDEARERAQFEQQLELAATQIIQVGGVDVGFVMLVHRSDSLQLHTLCVAPEHQGRGIGSLVTMDVAREGLAAGRGVVLSVLKVNRRAHALYERLGFEVVSASEHHLHMRYARRASTSGAS